jgi:GTPase Era involved in 16S rRNA processing
VQLGALLQRLIDDGAGLVAPRVLSDLAAGADRLANARCNVVVIGAFKRGKSTLINAMLERNVLPVGVLPLTSTVTVVTHGSSERVLVHFADGRTELHPLTALDAYTTELGNPANERGVTVVEVTLVTPLLASGLQLVDTPGIASIHRHNTRTAYDALGRVDAALCVVSADQPLSEQELELYCAAAERAGHMLCVLTKADQLTEAECERAIGFVSDALREHVVAVTDVLPVSAVDGRGLAELADRLRDIAADARGDVVARAVARTAHLAADELIRRCDLEARALELPLDDLHQRARVLDARLAELEAAHADANVLIERRVAAMLDELVNDPLRRYAREHDERLQAGLAARASELADRSPRAIAAALDQWIDETVRSTFADLAGRLRDAVAARLGEVVRSHAERIRGLLAEVQQAAADALGDDTLRELPDIVLGDPAGFRFKLHDPEHALDVIVGAARRAAPGPLGRRLVIADARQRLVAMTDRHAGRLRAEIVLRVNESTAEHRRALDLAMRETCSAIRDAIADAMRERAHGAQSARRRLSDLSDRRERAEAIQHALTATLVPAGDTDA